MLRDYLSHLIQSQRLTQAQAEVALQESQQRGLQSGAVLVERGWVSLMELPPGLRPPAPPPAPTPDSLFPSNVETSAGSGPGGRARPSSSSGQSLETLRPDIRRALADANAPRLGRYVLLGELGRGGMGVVHRAFDPELRREVAIKQLIPRDGESAGTLERRLQRFQLEGRAAAKLAHPLIVGVLEVGSDQGRPYLVMEYVEGTDLETLLNREDLSLRRKVELLRDVAEALGHAHQNGIVHRDVKPGNVMVDEAGRGRLTDFGLARDVEAGAGLSRTGQIMGTPRFLSPEQAAGQPDLTRPSTDVFALGGVLYMALTGLPPFPGENMVELLGMICGSEPVRPSKVNALINRDLETIVLKCLEKEQAHRYEHAGDVASELERFLAGEAIEARPLSGGERLWRAAGRNKAISALTVAFGLSLLCGGVYSVWAIRAERDLAHQERRRALKAKATAETARQESDAARAESEVARAEAETQRGVAAAAAKREAQARKRAERESEAKDLLLAQALAEKGGRLLSQKRHGRASSLFAASLLLRESSQARTGLMRSLERTRRERWSAGRSPLTSIAHLENGTLVVADLRGRIRVLEPGGESLALYGGTQGPVLSLDAAAGVVAAGLNSGQLAIWGSEDPNRPTLVPAHEGGVIALACNPGGSQIATVGLDATLKRWKADGTLLASYPLGFRPLCVAWSSDAAWLAAGGVDGLVAVRVADGALARAPKADRWITGLGFGPGGLFTADLQGSLIQWSIESPRESPSLRAGPAEPTGFPVTALAASDTGLVAVGSPLGKLRCYDSAQRAWTYETQLETHAITALHFDGQGRIAGTNERGVIGVFFPAKGKLNTTTTIARFTCLATLPLKSSTAFFAGDNRGRLTLGQSEALRAPATGPILPRRINGVAVSDNGALLAVCSNGRRLVVRNLSSQRQIELKGLSDGSAWSLDFYAERGLAASVGDKIRLWELPDPTPIIEVSAPGFVKAIACEPKTGRIAAAAVGGVVIWNTKGEELARLPLSVSAQDIAFDPGSQRVAIAAGTEILLWDPSRPGSEPRVLRGHEGVVLALAFNADGRRLVSGGNDSWVCLWDVRAGSLDTVLEGHQARVTDVEFDGLGQYAISVSEDGSIRTWDVAPPLAPREPPLGGWTLAFLRDGRLVSSGNTDGVVKSFDPATGATKGLFRSAARIHYLAEGPSQVLAFAAHRSRNVILFDLASSAQRHTLTHPGQVSALCFTPQPDQRLVTGSGLAIRIWDPATGKELKSWNLDREADHVSALGASPNGKWLAVGARASVHFFTPHGLGGPRIQLSEGHAPFGLDFSPNSRLLSVASQGLRQRARAVPLTGGAQRLEATGPGGLAEGEVHLLDVERQRSHSLRRHPRGSFATRFTPDGRFVAEGGGGIVLWEVATRRRWAEVVPGDDDLSRTSIAISPSGDLLATRTRKGHSKVWDLRKLGTYDSPAQAVHRAWRLSGYRVIGMNAIRSQTQTGFLIRSRMEELLRR